VNESLVEFFLSHDLYLRNCDVSPDMGPTWELSVDNSEVSSGLIPYCSNTSLFHEVVCLRRDSCATFYISNLNDTAGSLRYSLAMDNVTYRSKETDIFSNADGWNATTNMGKCTVDGLCDSSNQALFEVDLLTATEHVDNNGNSVSSIIDYDITWVFGNSATGWYGGGWYGCRRCSPLHKSGDYVNGAYELGSAYRTIECVPNDECVFDFNMTEESLPALEWYNVRRNGIGLSRVLLDSGGWGIYGARETTAFGEDCSTKNTLSGGAIAGIVIGCVAAVGALVYGLLWYKKKKEAAEEDANPLTDSLLAAGAGGTERMTDTTL